MSHLKFLKHAENNVRRLQYLSLPMHSVGI